KKEKYLHPIQYKRPKIYSRVHRIQKYLVYRRPIFEKFANNSEFFLLEHFKHKPHSTDISHFENV
ncbi:hypothetical protein DERP_004837, partial [Dermatophagoides pteronyssinus]